MNATPWTHAVVDPAPERGARLRNHRWLPRLALAGLTVLGTVGARAQTVSTRWDEDASKWGGSGLGGRDRGLVSAAFAGGRSRWSTEAAPSLFDGSHFGTLAGPSLELRDLTGSRSTDPTGEWVGWVANEVMNWVEQNLVMEEARFQQAAYAPASSGGSTSSLFVDVGTHRLQSDQAGQWVTLTARNESTSALAFSGLNFYAQIADSGPASEGGFGVIDGPNITQVDLVTGTPFSGNHTGTTPVSGNVPQGGQWTVSTLTGTVSIAPGATVTLARIQLDTTGFRGNDVWTLSLSAGPPGGFQGTTSVVQLGDGGWVDTLDVRFNPGTVAVPEPREMAVVLGSGLAAWVCLRRKLRAGR